MGYGTDIRDSLLTALTEGFDVVGDADRVDVLTHVGAIGMEVVVQVTDLSGLSQVDAYETMCDILAARIAGDADQVFGFLAFPDEPDPASLASGLALMSPRTNSDFTPILPLSRNNAVRLAESDTSVAYLIDDASALLSIATDHDPPTRSHAETLLGQLDELVDRHCGSTR